jgi:hypothetical protein
MSNEADRAEPNQTEGEKPGNIPTVVESLNEPPRARFVKKGRYLASIFSLVIILASVLLGRYSSASSLLTAIRILLVSLLGFHCVAFMTADCTRLWRCVGYPLALAGFIAILTALAGIQENARLAPLNAALADRKVAYDALIYSTKAVIENDCHPKSTRGLMYTPSPEPYVGACERMEHFLPQIEFSASAESKVVGLNSGEGWGLDIITPDVPTGAWLGLYNDAARFNESVKRTAKVLEESRKTPQSPLATWAASGAIRYWYFVLAFFLGLQLSKITADLLAPKPEEPRLLKR